MGDAMGEYEFTAPVSGIYHFQFYAKVFNSSSDFKLAITIKNQVLNHFYLDCSNCSIQTLHFSRIYRLKERDRIRLFKSGSNSTIVAGKINAYTTPSSFAGWLVEEIDQWISHAVFKIKMFYNCSFLLFLAYTQ